jgi:hypothetical protein
MSLAQARDIVISAHESAHAVASVRLNRPFDYVTLDDDVLGPHVYSTDNAPRPIPFYDGGGACCGGDQPICDNCGAELQRAESCIMIAVCGTLGVLATGCKDFGYGHEADKTYAVEFRKVAFGDQTDVQISARLKDLSDRAFELMRPESKTVSAVGRALREQRRLTEQQVRDIVQTESCA